MLHCIEEMKKQNYDFDAIFYARPTTPFKQKEKIEEAIIKLDNNDFTAIRSITKVEGVYHPYWMYKIKNNLLKTFIDNLDVTKYYQSQLLQDCYRLNGVVDIVKVETLLKYENIYGDRIGFIEIDEIHSVDIDTEYEFLLCEFLIERGLI
jgi:CMP-N-acetylneuraminic acid synthetase